VRAQIGVLRGGASTEITARYSRRAPDPFDRSSYKVVLIAFRSLSPMQALRMMATWGFN